MIGKELKVYDGLTPIQQLNLYRNLYYTDGNATEHGIIANAINDILPVVRKSIGKEVIRALECCANGECDECPYQESSPCKEYLNNAALDLINRQRAEIVKARSEGAREFYIALYNEIIHARDSNFEAIKERVNKHGVDRNEDTFCFYCDGKIHALDGIYHFMDEFMKKYAEENNNVR